MSDRPLTILVLHHLGDPRVWRTSMVEKEMCLPLFAPGHEYVVHNAALPLPGFVKDVDFDGIVLTQTFLGRRRHPGVLRRILEEYAFVKHSPAFKIALPQDDYHCSATLDRWLMDWGVDLTYPVISQHWNVLYPTYAATRRLRLGYTGYINDEMVRRWQSPKPISDRRIDVSYRASKLPPTHGRLGYLKGIIGERFVEKAKGRGLVLDISTRPRDVIVGSGWYTFLEDSRFVLGANSGVSLHDPDGTIQTSVMDYTVLHPRASFEEVEAACFPGLDGTYEFTAISPRNIECALLESVQILTPGPYSGMLEAGRHFIPLDPDMGNVEDVFAMIRDAKASTRIAKACKDALLSYEALRYRHHAHELISEIANACRGGAGTDARRSPSVAGRYETAMSAIEKSFWRRQRLVERLRAAAVSLGVQYVKRFVMDKARGGAG